MNSMLGFASMLGGAGAYALYSLIGRDPKKKELEDELQAAASAARNLESYRMMREAAERLLPREPELRASVLLYREIETKFEGALRTHEARVKMLEVEIKNEDEKKAAQRAVESEQEKAGVAERVTLKLQNEQLQLTNTHLSEALERTRTELSEEMKKRFELQDRLTDILKEDLRGLNAQAAALSRRASKRKAQKRKASGR